MLDGTYSNTTDDLGQDILEVLSGSHLTRAKLKSLYQALARASVEAAADPEAAIQEIERVDPAVGGVVRQFWDSLDTTQKLTTVGIGVTALGVLLTVLMSIVTIIAADRREQRGQPSEERIRQIIEEQMIEGWQDPLPPPSPSLEPSPSGPEDLQQLEPDGSRGDPG